MAEMTILYRQSIEKNDDADSVSVVLRKWISPYAEDYVLDQKVVVDGEEEVYTKTLLDCLWDWEAIRFAIETFDQLLESHPMSHMKE